MAVVWRVDLAQGKCRLETWAGNNWFWLTVGEGIRATGICKTAR